MNFPILRPNISLRATKNQRFAIYGHLLSLLGGFLLVVSGFFTFFSNSLAILGVLTGSIILIVEMDKFNPPPLKNPTTRGVIWFVLAAFSLGVSIFAIVIPFVGAACYLVYDNQ